MNSSIIIALVTIIAGVIIFTLKICFASKCEKVNLCFGLLKISREVELEAKVYNNEKSSPNEIKQMQNSLDMSTVLEQVVSDKLV